MQFSPPRPTKRLISLTPLIDVVFILLVFFMLASSYLDWHSIDLSVSSGKGETPTAQRAILVNLRADGAIHLGATPVGQLELASLVAARLVEKPGQRVVIRSEPGVALQRAVDILDRLRDVGATNVSLSRTR